MSYLVGLERALQNLGSANILVNGGFEIWQLGTSFSSPASNTIVADQWRTSFGVSPVYTINREASIIDGGLYSMKFDLTSVGSCASIILLQYLNNPELYIGKSLSLSMRVKTNKANCIRIRMYNSTDGASYSAYHTGDNTWQTLTVTKTITVANMDISFGMYTGDIQVATTYVDSAMLVIANEAQPFTPLPHNDDLARCLSFYETSRQEIDVPILRTSSTNYYLITVLYSVVKSAVPTVTITKNFYAMYHTPLSGNGNSGTDGVNWTANGSGSISTAIVSGQRSPDQTTYPTLDADFTFVAQVT